MLELPLPGGFVNTVVRVGDTVRRPPPDRADFVHGLLRLLQTRDWPGAPRLLGTDERGRDIFGHLDGHVAWEERQPADVTSDESLAAAARLVREFHDLTAGTPLAGDREVVCHNDLSPRNTVYRPVEGRLRPVAFLDWDLAAPGPRLHDVAHVCWQYAGLGPAADAADAARRVRLIADGYGLTDRRDLVSTVLWWQDRCWRGIQSGADAGDPAMRRLRDSGTVTRVRRAYQWTADHRGALERALL
ncbi:phosphotransferase [Streptomyces sp. CRN 30]|uniref:phosphotransferase n=1 Tax=Streptomyces sp. CRN 30 TaxID=3075613 RepID=UPI002A800E42|nr:phosphotransferase [Streptomyces sp. CRN 30]